MVGSASKYHKEETMIKTEMLDDVAATLIDTNTGEIIEDAVSEASVEKLIYALLAKRKRIEALVASYEESIRTITEIHNDKVSRINKTVEFLEGKIADKMKVSGLPKVECPGAGVARFRKTVEKVDRTAYDDAGVEVQQQLHNDYPQYFKETVSVKPIMKEIKRELSWKGDVPLFTLIPSTEKFEFKPE
jgi:hypothetical protein